MNQKGDSHPLFSDCKDSKNNSVGFIFSPMLTLASRFAIDNIPGQDLTSRNYFFRFLKKLYLCIDNTYYEINNKKA